MPAKKTIVVSDETKNAMDRLKTYPRETYDDLIKKMIPIYKEKGLRKSDQKFPLKLPLNQ